MPTDTLLFHLTRLNHMVISCVACGQCTSACPNNISIAKIFKSIGSKVQGVFEYKPGENPDEEIPQAVFKEDELHEMGAEAPEGKK
jgi:formate dehydrogenase subunit beta